jgi:hypothetical protein
MNNKNKYDSQAEQTFHEQYPHLQLVTGTYYQTTFEDSNGVAFNARPDFYCTFTDLQIEFKCNQLNTTKSKADSQMKLDKQREHKALSLYDLLNFGWNHSIYKQGKVGRTIPNFCIVFTENTKLSSYSKNLMDKQGINWMFIKQYQKKLNQSLCGYTRIEKEH